MEKLDPLTWSVEPVQALPDALTAPGRCATIQMDSVPGIYLKQGYWFSLEDFKFRPVAPVPGVPLADDYDSLSTFRGAPAVFGHVRLLIILPT